MWGFCNCFLMSLIAPFLLPRQPPRPSKPHKHSPPLSSNCTLWLLCLKSWAIREDITFGYSQDQELGLGLWDFFSRTRSFSCHFACLGIRLWVSEKDPEIILIITDVLEIKVNWMECKCIYSSLYLYNRWMTSGQSTLAWYHRCAVPEPPTHNKSDLS